MNDRPLVFLPTYNEKDNVEAIFGKLSELGIEMDILFLDDNSSDGTGRILDGIAERNPHVNVVHRPGKLGIGSAHADGIRWAYQHGYRRLITMDCDFAHPPEYIHAFLEAAERHAVVVGSRFMREESLVEWNPFRKTLTMLGHFLTRHLLRMEYDATGAFRYYDLERIPVEAFGLVESKGYSFFFESLYVLHLNGFPIAEVPIHLPARTYGTSKMSVKEVFRSVRMLLQVYRKTLFRREDFLLPDLQVEVDPALVDPQGWDAYWKAKDRVTFILYDLIAVFYRKFIIRPLLNHFVTKHLPRGGEVLHAGCGSGQVDTDVRERVSITALDISPAALSFYSRVNQRRCKLLHGSIFNIPAPDATYDGVYNLGVMEHFTEAEIHRILLEFRRVLKPGGRLLLFWPPEFGSSVIFLKGVHFVLNRILRRNIKLHPDEISRIRSRKHVEGLLAASGFVVERYSFSARDLFTYVVVVARPSARAAETLPENSEQVGVFA